MTVNKLILGVTGASGIAYALDIMRQANRMELEVHLVATQAAEMTLAAETDTSVSQMKAMADVVHNIKNIGASIASGSFRTAGMIVAPCSMNSMSEIAYGTTSNLLTRAADVQLKERRRVVLMVRETPLHVGHLRAMTQATENGAIIMPPVPAFYTKPQTLNDVVVQTAAKALDLLGFAPEEMKRWKE